MKKLLAVLFAVVVGVLAYPAVSAQSQVPYNGTFDSGVDGWINLTGSNGGWTSAGHYGSGALTFVSGGSGQTPVYASHPFVPSSSSVLSYWMYHASCFASSSGYIDWTARYVSELDYANDCTNRGWYNITATLSAFANHWVSLYYTTNSTAGYLDDVSVSNASNASGSEWVNGQFPLLWQDYYWINAGDIPHWNVGNARNIGCGSLSWASSYGSDGSSGGYCLPAYGVGYSFTQITSLPFVLSSASWSFSIKCENTKTFTFGVTRLASSYTIVSGTCNGAWQSYSFNVGSLVGYRVAFFLSQTISNASINTYLDDIVPSGGMSQAGTPTPLPTATSSAGGGSYPTQIPYPTQLPFPTAIYGAGTPIPVQGSCGTSSTPCYVIISNTPVPVILNGGTPIFPYGAGTPLPVEVDSSTPVVVAIATQGPITAVARRSDLVSVSAPTSVNTTFQGPIDLTSRPDTRPPIEMSAQSQSVGFCLPSQVTQFVQLSGSEMCTSFGYFSVLSLRLGPLMVSDILGVVMSVVAIVMIVRQFEGR